MKKIALTFMACVAAMQLVAAEAVWLTDLEAAKKQAKAENKLILLDFTGSDWCGWCIKLKDEVFSKAEFSEYAQKNLVLVEVDFPRRKVISKEQLAKNEALEKKFKIEGYPTIIIVNSEGKQVGEPLGYMQGGPKAFLAELEKVKAESKKKS